MEGKPIEQVRALWAAYARGGLSAMREVVGDQEIEWVPLGADAPVGQEEFWASWGRERERQVSISMHSFEEHGSCVLAHGSMRTFREGGFIDVQPSWVYFFRDGVLVRAAGFPTREAAIEAISRWRAGG